MTGPGAIELWAGIYDGLTARLALAAKFDALWLGSFGFAAAQYGMPDAGHIDPHDVELCVERLMPVIGGCPLVVDVENGYGLDADCLAAASRRFFGHGANGICIEDTVGPKACSLWQDTARDLRPATEMAKLLSVLTHQKTSSRQRVVARTESLVEGSTVSEAIDRVSAYHGAGADIVIVHFREKVDHVFAVAEACKAIPLGVIPTMAPHVPSTEFAEAGFSVYIAANVAVRASALAIDQTYAAVRASGRLTEANAHCLPLKEFRSIVEGR